MPALQRVHEAYAEDGLVVLGVNMTAQDTLTDAEEFVRQRQLTFPILLDVDGDTARSYRMHSLPTTFFVDREGVIRDQVIGGPMPEALLRAKAIELLGSEP
jgi:peroxiredoxin